MLLTKRKKSKLCEVPKNFRRILQRSKFQGSRTQKSFFTLGHVYICVSPTASKCQRVTEHSDLKESYFRLFSDMTLKLGHYTISREKTKYNVLFPVLLMDLAFLTNYVKLINQKKT